MTEQKSFIHKTNLAIKTGQGQAQSLRQTLVIKQCGYILTEDYAFKPAGRRNRRLTLMIYLVNKKTALLLSGL